LVLENIVKKSRDEEIKPVESYVKKQLAHTLNDLIMFVAPDSDWKNLLESTLDWREHFPLFPEMRKSAISELTQILQNPDYIISDKLRNDITQILEILHNTTYIQFSAQHNDNIYVLCQISTFSSAVISQSVELVKQHGLLDAYGVEFTFKEGEAPQIVSSEIDFDSTHGLSKNDEYLKRAIEFRDECHRRQKQKSS
jgi:hypothetical protein